MLDFHAACFEQFLDFLRRSVDRKLFCFSISRLEFHDSVFRTAADRDPERNADQIHVLEFDARAGIAIIEDRIDAEILQLLLPGSELHPSWR